jgi:hypothetical protein
MLGDVDTDSGVAVTRVKGVGIVPGAAPDPGSAEGVGAGVGGGAGSGPAHAAPIMVTRTSSPRIKHTLFFVTFTSGQSKALKTTAASSGFPRLNRRSWR